jgi:hypothetical protein
MSKLYCTYCGSAQGDRISCFQEDQWMTLTEYQDYHNEDPSGWDGAHGALDYRLPEQYYADQAHEKRRPRMLGED